MLDRQLFGATLSRNRNFECILIRRYIWTTILYQTPKRLMSFILAFFRMNLEPMNSLLEIKLRDILFQTLGEAHIFRKAAIFPKQIKPIGHLCARVFSIANLIEKFGKSPVH